MTTCPRPTAWSPPAGRSRSSTRAREPSSASAAWLSRCRHSAAARRWWAGTGRTTRATTSRAGECAGATSSSPAPPTAVTSRPPRWSRRRSYQSPAQPDDSDEFVTPCPEPAGGWRVVDAAKTTEATMEQTIRAASRLDGYAGLVGRPVDQPALVAGGRRVRHERPDQADHQRAGHRRPGGRRGDAPRDLGRRALRHPGGAHATRSCRRIQNALNDAHGMLSTSVNDQQVELEVVYDDGSLQRRARPEVRRRHGRRPVRAAAGRGLRERAPAMPRPTAMKTVLAAFALVTLAACGGQTDGGQATDPAGSPSDSAVPTDVPAASGTVHTRGLVTVMDTGSARALPGAGRRVVPAAVRRPRPRGLGLGGAARCVRPAGQGPLGPVRGERALGRQLPSP